MEQFNWQDISSAPLSKWILVRGGRQVLQCYGYSENIGPAVVARKDPTDEYWFAGDSEADDASTSTRIDYEAPTHWMDVPK
jgi:hypothetical protein